MIINIGDDILKLHRLGLLDIILEDKTTKRNIMWATDVYAERGELFERNAEITPALVTGDNAGLIKTRARKAFEQQSERTKKRAEVFTPLWVVRKMNDYADETWFNRRDGVNKLDKAGHIAFTAKHKWQYYVENRRMELTCGEAPFLVTRYDAESGEMLPLSERTGILDRKLRAVNENAEAPDEWLEWTFKALQSTYGYEFQGDNLFIARINLLMTFEENMEAVWHRKPTLSHYKRAINIIAWNIWQMDGLNDRVPYSLVEEQFSLFEDDAKERRPYCRINNWRQQRSIQFRSMKGERTKMKFDYIIGNPPYQDETLGDNKGFAPPIYDKFLDESYKLADKVEMIHPARFLFNAGSTPKAWNKKMLEDSHLKILFHEQNSSKVFANTDIKGGVAITYHDTVKNFGAIGTFTPFDELNSILHKVKSSSSFESIVPIVITRTAYRLTDKMHEDHPEAIGQLSNGHAYDMSTNIFERLPQIFFNEKPNDGEDYIKILGRENNVRVYKFIRRDYVNDVINLNKYKIILPKSNGSGALGEVLTTPLIGEPLIGEPLIGETESCISIGIFDTMEEADACFKYIKSRFARTLLGVLKVTQDNPPDKWKYVPLQDFTSMSDIDWNQSVADIDVQLYRKYGLDEAEIAFIESGVKEME